MKHLLLEPNFQAWREAARDALRHVYKPYKFDLHDAGAPVSLLRPMSSEAAQA